GLSASQEKKILRKGFFIKDVCDKKPFFFLFRCSTEAQCPIPTIAHGQLSSAENFTFGSTATLQCDPGFVGTASAARCTSTGRWYPRVPSCIPGQCRHPPSVEFADSQPRREFPVGTTLSYSCRTGFSPIPGVSPTITCLQNFSWSTVPRLCQKVQCPRPAIPHGTETSPSRAEYTFGQHVEFQCDHGFKLRGNDRVQCSSDGIWRPPVPHCDRVCGPPPKITNGQHSGMFPWFTYGSEVKYSCAEGLSLIGHKSLYCTSEDGENLTWSGPAPECRGEWFGVTVASGHGTSLMPALRTNRAGLPADAASSTGGG
uniref:Sushi domain-containing protein n=1 Tax=Junco hyemalis TaxID=40217 RepID=A0A8C5JS23_JUNHY